MIQVTNRIFAILISLLLTGAVFAQNDVSWQVDMSLAIADEFFKPADGDTVSINGAFNGWGGAGTSWFLTDDDGDEVYTATYNVWNDSVATAQFKYIVHNPDGTLNWEGDPNREFTTTGSPLALDLHYWNRVPAVNDVTFQVDMQIPLSEGSFDPAAGDTVAIAGSFNGWGGAGTSNFLTDDDGDEVYAGTYTVFEDSVGAAVQYKHIIVNPDGTINWEDDPNREFSTTGLPQTLDVEFWNRIEPSGNDITWQVNMSLPLADGAFVPENGDTVAIAGSFNGWGGAGTTNFLEDNNGDFIYDGTYNVSGDTADITVQFKYIIVNPDGTINWEGDPNREFVTTGLPQTLMRDDGDPHWWNRLPAGTDTVSILFQVDMTVFEDLGLMDRVSGDVMEVRGGFNGWSGDDPLNAAMVRLPGTEVYTLNATVSAEQGSQVFYKYFADLDSTRHPTLVGQGWEEPLSTAGGNRSVVMPTDDIILDVTPFWDLPFGGVIENTTTTLNFTVDMNPALDFDQPFVPATDSVFISLEDQFQGELQGGRERGAQSDWYLSDADGDLIYEGSVEFDGPALYGLIYRYSYGATSSTVVSEGGGFDFGKNRVRYVIPKNAAGDFPIEFTFAVDAIQEDPPLVVEDAPIDPITNEVLFFEEDSSSVVGIGTLPDGTPVTFALAQNYPNPFNPSTTIKFTTDKVAAANLTIYNILGQKVRVLYNEVAAPGQTKLVWDATNDLGQPVSSGVYFYTLTIGERSESAKMILMR